MNGIGAVFCRAALAAGLSVAGPAGPVRADALSDAILRSQTQAAGRAVGTQIQQAFRPSYYQPPPAGPQMVLNPGGAVFHAGPGSATPVIGHLGTGTPVLVTRPAGNAGWVEVLSEGRFGYVWAPQLSPSGFPPGPGGGAR